MAKVIPIRVFDLSLCFSYMRKDSYYITSDFRIFSRISSGFQKELVIDAGTDKQFKASRIYGTPKSAGDVIFSFAGVSTSHRRSSCTFREIKNGVMVYLAKYPAIRDFLNSKASSDVEVKRVETKVQQNPGPANFQSYVIAALKDGVPVFSARPKVHSSWEDARNEASRLANVSQGTKFVIFKAYSAVVAGSTSWTHSPEFLT